MASRSIWDIEFDAAWAAIFPLYSGPTLNGKPITLSDQEFLDDAAVDRCTCPDDSGSCDWCQKGQRDE